MTYIMCMFKDVAVDMLFRKPLAHAYRCPCSYAPCAETSFGTYALVGISQWVSHLRIENLLTLKYFSKRNFNFKCHTKAQFIEDC